MTNSLVDSHPQQTLDRLLGVLAADPHVVSIHIGGSMARGEADEFSDLDL
jgi:predicted nucleotidyltransferase